MLTANDNAGVSRRTIAGREILVATLSGSEFLAREQLRQPPDLGRWRQRLGAY